MRGDRGMILVVVLWIVALLTVAMYSALMVSRTEYSLANTYEDDEKLKHIALSGVEYAIAVLMEDQTPYDTLTDEWVESETLFKEHQIGEGFFSLVRPAVDGGEGFAYGVLDEASLFPLNHSAWEHLASIEGLDDAMAQAIVDWRDEDTDPLPEGAEDSYYMSLNPGYSVKNAPYETVEELLYVRDITPSVLFGKDRNANGTVDGSETTDDQATSDFGIIRWVTAFTRERNLNIMGEPRVHLNNASNAECEKILQMSFSPQKIQVFHEFRRNEKFQTVAQVCGLHKGNIHVNRPEMQPTYDFFTVTDSEYLYGRININTAPEKVVRAVAGLIPQVIQQWPKGIIPPQNPTEEDLQNILERRKSGDANLASVSWLMREPGWDPRFRTLAPNFTTKSRQFRIDVIARLDDKPLFKRFRVIVEIDREKGTSSILYFRDISHLFFKAWDEPSGEVVGPN